MKKINLPNRGLVVTCFYIFFSASMLTTSWANSFVPIVTTKPIALAKLSVLDETSQDSVDARTTIRSKLAPCQTKQLSLRRANVEGGMGHTGAIYIFTNTSSSTCTLDAYPGFALLDINNQQMEEVKIKLSKNNYFHHTQQQSVTLTPGNRASFSVASTHISRSARNCPSSAKVEITPPNADRHFTIVEKRRSCDAISITPIESGMIKH